MTISGLWRCVAFMTAAVLTGLSGCDMGSSRDVAGGAASKKESATGSAEEIEQRRYNAAVGAINRTSNHALSGWRNYARQFNPERGPTGREASAMVDTLDHSWVRESINALKAASADAQTKDALVEASTRYATAVELLIPLTVEAHRYYQQQDWKDDKFAKAKEMHPKLVAAYREFAAADSALTAEVRRVGDLRHQARLAKLKASGQMLRHDVQLNLRQARDMIEFLEAQMTKVKRPQDMDLAGIKERIDAYDATLAALRQAAAQGPERANKEFGYRAHNFNSYLSYADGLLRTAKDILRAGRDRTPMPELSHPHAPGGNALAGHYNDMVGTVNGLNSQ